MSATPIIDEAATRTDGLGCHAGKDEMRRAAAAAGKSESLAQYAADYPAGPHDQPQSMCPAFGSLRVGLRMRRTATVLSHTHQCEAPKLQKPLRWAATQDVIQYYPLATI